MNNTLVQDMPDQGPLTGVGTEEVMAVLNSTPAPAEPTPSPTPAPASTPAPATTAAPAATPTPTPAPAVSGQQPSPTVPQATPAPGPAPVSATAESPELLQLRSEIAQLKGFVEGQRQAAPQPNQPEVKFEDQLPAHGYQFPLPDQVMASLNSDDVGQQKQALGAIMQAVATVTHRSVLQQTSQFINQHVGRMIQETITAARVSEQVNKDFYGSNPDLNDPAIYPIVGNVAQQLMQQQPALFQQGWTPAVRDLVERQVRVLLNRPKPGAPQQVVTPAAPPAASMVMPTGAARPAMPARGTMADDIASTLFSGDF